jgi:hypothetical protein
MSRMTYESLFDSSVTGDATQDMVAAFAQAGALRKAAHDLATDEMLEGLWVQDILDESEVRLAADDRSDLQRTLTGGAYAVEIQWMPADIYTAKQTAGPAGATLVIDGQWIPLEPGSSVDLPITAMPTELSLVDLKGKKHTLR